MAIPVRGAAVLAGGLVSRLSHSAMWTAKDTKRQLVDAKEANKAWAERFALQGQLATRDAQLAAEQSKASEVRTVEVIKN